MVNEPWLTTERLILRRPQADDVGSVFEIHSNPLTYRHHPNGVMSSPEEAALLLAAWVGHWDAHGFGYATVERRADGVVIGFAGAKHQHLPGQQILNLYYRFDPGAWGQGHATEATTAIVAWLAAHHPELPVVARVATGNPASVRVAERIGLVLQDLHDPHDPVEHRLYSSASLRPSPVKQSGRFAGT